MRLLQLKASVDHCWSYSLVPADSPACKEWMPERSSSYRRIFVLLLLVLSCIEAPGARADHFGFRSASASPGAAGVVTAHGVDLFEIRSPAGGLQPSQRAAVISARLETLAETHQIRPEFFTVGYRNHEVVLQDSQETDRLPLILVTIDQALARKIPGANGDVETLAEWWLAVLRDHIYLALGQPPVCTMGTPIGNIFRRLYQSLGSPTGAVTDTEIRRAILQLPPDMQQALSQSAYRVPVEYHLRSGEETTIHEKDLPADQDSRGGLRDGAGSQVHPGEDQGAGAAHASGEDHPSGEIHPRMDHRSTAKRPPVENQPPDTSSTSGEKSRTGRETSPEEKLPEVDQHQPGEDQAQPDHGRPGRTQPGSDHQPSDSSGPLDTTPNPTTPAVGAGAGGAITPAPTGSRDGQGEADNGEEHDTTASGAGGSQGVTPNNGAGATADPNAGAAAAAGAEATAGRYRVRLQTDPSRLLPGQRAELILKIEEVKAGAENTAPLTGAVAAARLRSRKADPSKPWVLARLTEVKPGTYTFHAVFRGAGDYQLSVTVVPAADNPFTVMLGLQTAAAPQ